MDLSIFKQDGYTRTHFLMDFKKQMDDTVALVFRGFDDGAKNSQRPAPNVIFSGNELSATDSPMAYFFRIWTGQMISTLVIEVDSVDNVVDASISSKINGISKLGSYGNRPLPVQGYMSCTKI